MKEPMAKPRVSAFSYKINFSYYFIPTKTNSRENILEIWKIGSYAFLQKISMFILSLFNDAINSTIWRKVGKSASEQVNKYFNFVERLVNFYLADQLEASQKDISSMELVNNTNYLSSSN
jgi:hypothetical protein